MTIVARPPTAKEIFAFAKAKGFTKQAGYLNGSMYFRCPNGSLITIHQVANLLLGDVN